jgi:lipopolysaccharide transport system permease protein
MSEPAPLELVIRPRSGLLGIDAAELWRYRELFVFLAWRDILVRYKQTAIGILWAVIQPVLTMIIFTVIFGKVAELPSGGAPYAVMTMAAVIPWQFFANAIAQSSQSVVGSQNMVQKVYFPRLIIPVSSTLSGAVDFLISLGLLLALMLWYGVAFTWTLLLLPLFSLLALAAALSVGIWMSALNVKYRDVKYIVPFVVSMGLYVSPVGYMSSVVPKDWQFWYSLNPMVGVIDGFRWAVLGHGFEPYWPGFWTSIVVVFVLLATSLAYFRATERTFADII